MSVVNEEKKSIDKPLNKEKIQIKIKGKEESGKLSLQRVVSVQDKNWDNERLLK